MLRLDFCVRMKQAISQVGGKVTKSYLRAGQALDESGYRESKVVRILSSENCFRHRREYILIGLFSSNNSAQSA